MNKKLCFMICLSLCAFLTPANTKALSATCTTDGKNESTLTTKTQTYTINSACGQKCTETITIKYNKPITVLAGMGFDYPFEVTSTMKCDSYYNSEPEPRCTREECWATCGYEECPDLGPSGPDDKFDECIFSCDGGKYSQKCINSCNLKLYNLKNDNSYSIKKLNNYNKSLALNCYNVTDYSGSCDGIPSDVKDYSDCSKSTTTVSTSCSHSDSKWIAWNRRQNECRSFISNFESKKKTTYVLKASDFSLTIDDIKTKTSKTYAELLMENGKYVIPEIPKIEKYTGLLGIPNSDGYYEPGQRYYYTNIFTPTTFFLNTTYNNQQYAGTGTYNIHITTNGKVGNINTDPIKIDCYYDVINKAYTTGENGVNSPEYVYRPITIGIKDAIFPKRQARWNWTTDHAKELISKIEGTPASTIYSDQYLNYAIKLTPDDIKAIRVYNKGNNYLNFDMNCSYKDDDKTNPVCYSTLLSTLKDSTGSSVRKGGIE